jgi:hypothetical protein
LRCPADPAGYEGVWLIDGAKLEARLEQLAILGKQLVRLLDAQALLFDIVERRRNIYAVTIAHSYPAKFRVTEVAFVPDLVDLALAVNLDPGLATVLGGNSARQREGLLKMQRSHGDWYQLRAANRADNSDVLRAELGNLQCKRGVYPGSCECSENATLGVAERQSGNLNAPSTRHRNGTIIVDGVAGAF